MTSQFFLMLLVLTSTSFVFMLFIKLQEKTRVLAKRLPPGPWKLPVLGNLHQLNGDSPHVSLQHLSNDYGPLMFLQLGSVPTLVISSADVAREIFRTHDLIFSGRPRSYAAKKFSYNFNNRSFAPYAQSSTKPIDLSRLTLLLSNNIVCRVAFGQKSDRGEYNGRSRFDELLHQAQALLGKSSMADFLPWMGWLNMFNGVKASIEKTFREIDNFFDEEIQHHLDPRRPKPEHEDLVDVLLQIHTDADAILSFKQIKGVLMDIFVAGTDTSSATLVWTMAELIRNPSVMRRAQNEVRGVVKGKEVVEESDLFELVYLKLVVKEALILRPPAPLLVPRETTEDCRIGEYEIPSGARVLINAKAIATDPEYWEHPFEFRPERFLNCSIDFKGQNFELIPFGVGRRACPGINFAIPLIELALANLLYSFDWELPPGMRIEDLDMEEAPGITMHMKTPLFLMATAYTST
ncbi:cytochrome P450 71A25 [Citrus sinensis]|uniref:Cytochrome P450 71A25 n=1 Tax=Citrus sinensis TaxID=2711 RepID=A0ACB8LT47_CITSI|nr:cytochrome P450 71A25 [Citrus sinensis]